MPSSYKKIIKVRKPIKQIKRIPVDPIPQDADVLTAPLPEETEGNGETPQSIESEPQEEEIRISRSEFQQEIEFAYKKGLEEGKLEGFRTAEAELGQSLQMVEELITKLQAYQEEFLSQHQEVMVELLFKIAERIVGPLAEQQKNLIQTTLNKILQEAQIAGRIKIMVHPEDLNALQSLEPELKKNFPDLKEIGLVADEMVSRGGCLVETDLGKLDARIETQIHELIKHLRKLAATL